MSILVIGDAMLDKHTEGEVKRLSPEAPVPVVDAGAESRLTLGAAANVAAQVAAAGIKCYFAYKEFDHDPDGSHERLWTMLHEKDVIGLPLVYHEVSFPVTTKERVWAGGQQVCRIDRENIQKPTSSMASEWVNKLKHECKEKDVQLVIFSDYDKGTLTDYIIQSIADFCWDNNVPTILDPKRYSYFGLQKLSIIKPNQREVSMTNMSPSELSIELGETMLLHTLGKEGMKLWQNGEHIASEGVYARPEEVVDVCGCGDTVSAFLGISLYEQRSIGESMRVASIAAATNTRYRGCHILDAEEIRAVRSLPTIL